MPAVGEAYQAGPIHQWPPQCQHVQSALNIPVLWCRRCVHLCTCKRMPANE